METKKDLRRELAEARRTIEFLRAKLCEGPHQWVVVNTSVETGMPVSRLVCTRCGKVEVR